jgi:hypothetical protein
MSFIFPIIGLLLVFSGYNYASNLENCACVNPQYVNRIKTVEYILLIIMTIGIIFKFMLYVNVTTFNQLVTIIKTYSHIKYIYSIYILSVLCIYAYFVSSVYDFNKTMQSNCSCAQKWQLTLLNTQSVIYAIILVLYLLLALGLLYYMTVMRK